jgi:hypothetical protein
VFPAISSNTVFDGVCVRSSRAKKSCNDLTGRI